MSESQIYFHPKEPLIALVGNPNCGKTALFNRLTGAKQHVANYAGVTVERKEGELITPQGQKVRILDLPGVYSLYPRSPDEKVTCDVLAGKALGEKKPDLVVCVLDATNLRRGLRLALAVKRMGLPCIVNLNMMDEAIQLGLDIDIKALSKELGLPVTTTVAVKKDGDLLLRQSFDDTTVWQANLTEGITTSSEEISVEEDHIAVQRILTKINLQHAIAQTRSDQIDNIILHPVLGPIILVIILFAIFQAMFSWSSLPMELIKSFTEFIKATLLDLMPNNWIRSLLIDGIIAGAMGVVTFLPQILFLFLFILVLEESGYLPRAAYLLDRLMGSVGLSGRSFIPLLSCFACAIPGILATRTIPNPRDRKVTMLLAPLMTCSARLPVYSLLIGAFIPHQQVFSFIELQGLVMLGLYFCGILGALIIAWCLKTFTKAGQQVRPLMMELPRYRWPSPRNIVIGLWQRALIFLKRVGGTILFATIVIWFLCSFPLNNGLSQVASVEQSFAGMIGKYLAALLEPVGFNWQISVSLIPGMLAREVSISSLGTVYSLSSASAEGVTEQLSFILANQWSLATGLSLLAWFIFAPQCISTLMTIKRESGGWVMPLVTISYLFTLAYLASLAVFQTAKYFGLG